MLLNTPNFHLVHSEFQQILCSSFVDARYTAQTVKPFKILRLRSVLLISGIAKQCASLSLAYLYHLPRGRLAAVPCRFSRERSALISARAGSHSLSPLAVHTRHDITGTERMLPNIRRSLHRQRRATVGIRSHQWGQPGQHQYTH